MKIRISKMSFYTAILLIATGIFVTLRALFMFQFGHDSMAVAAATLGALTAGTLTVTIFFISLFPESAYTAE